MNETLLRLLDQLPFNGKKTYIGLFGGALVLGLQQMGYLDPQIGGYLLDAVTLWTGFAVAHRDLKATAVE